MNCPICHRYAPPDQDTGYDAPDVCPTCAEQGWTYDAHRALINEHDEEFAVNGQDVRR